MENNKSILIPLRVPADRRQAWKAAAERAGVTLNEWACDRLDKALPAKQRAGLVQRRVRGRPKTSS